MVWVFACSAEKKLLWSCLFAARNPLSLLSTPLRTYPTVRVSCVLAACSVGGCRSFEHVQFCTPMTQYRAPCSLDIDFSKYCWSRSFGFWLPASEGVERAQVQPLGVFWIVCMFMILIADYREKNHSIIIKFFKCVEAV